jgi:glucoamylase
LVWAHAEHIKLLRSLKDGVVFDMPPQPFNRYVRNKPAPAPVVWRMKSESRQIKIGSALRLEFLEPARVHCSSGNVPPVADSQATGLGTFTCDLPTQSLTEGSVVAFTVYWTGKGSLSGKNFQVTVVK